MSESRPQREQHEAPEASLLHALMESIPDAIYFKDRDSRFLLLSRAMLEKFGLASLADAIGKTDADIFTEEHANQALADERAVVATGEPLVARIERETWPDRPDTWVSTTKMPLRNRDGEIVGTFGISRDITELHEMQEALRKARDAADSANRAKSEFLANVSHEIRTPLNGIIGMTELLLAAPHTDEQDENLRAIRSSADALLSILNDVLDFSKIEQGKLGLEQIPFSLRDTLSATLRMLAVRAAQKNLELLVHIPATTPDALVGDPLRLRQVIVNLVGNAIKFTQRGEVVLTVEATQVVGDPDGQPHASAPTNASLGGNASATQLHFAVLDSGVGIAPERQEAVFQAFVQADSSTTREHGGTGLGLAIAAQIVRLMGGRLWVESTPGRGSVFHFAASFGRGADREWATPEALAALRDVPVLVVDDHPGARAVCRDLLAGWGARVDEASSGMEAVERICRRETDGDPYRVVLLDYQMPEMDGMEVVQDPDWHRLQRPPRAILMTSAARTGDRQQAAELGMARCITKPVTHGDLLEALLHAVGPKGAPREVAPAPLPPLGQAADAPEVEPRCVLLAEDGVVNQQIVQRLLEMRGHAVTVVSNGREAWEAATRHPYDVVLMDIQMPEMDGFEATAKIRAAEQGSDRRTPIVALTAHAMRGDRERCLASGMDRYLAKPFRPDQLFAAVERLDLDEDDAPEASAPADSGGYEAWDRAAALALVAGRPSLLADVIHVFLLQCPLQVADVSAALREGDWEAARAGVHALRGAVSAFGARRTLDAAQALEQAAQREDSTACRTAEETLLAELARLRQALEAHVRGG